MTTATLTRPTLTLADRCDACGAQAFTLAVFSGGRDLLFCNHHGTKYLDALVLQGAEVFQNEVSQRSNDTDH